MIPLRIVVIEDDAMIGWMLAETLTAMGHDVCAVEATEGAAVAAAARHRPDLLIVDIHLAEGNGISAMERITRAGPVPHLFISGDDAHTSLLRAEFLRKPFREADLAAAIGRALVMPGRPGPELGPLPLRPSRRSSDGPASR